MLLVATTTDENEHEHPNVVSQYACLGHKLSHESLPCEAQDGGENAVQSLGVLYILLSTASNTYTAAQQSITLQWTYSRTDTV